MFAQGANSTRAKRARLDIGSRRQPHGLWPGVSGVELGPCADLDLCEFENSIIRHTDESSE